MKKTTFILSILLMVCLQTSAQHIGLKFQDAEKQGIGMKHLDSIYKSAVHTDNMQAVFKTEKEQQAMGEAYVKLLQDFGKFLNHHKFKWEKPARCFNRIYFSPDGTIDYFLFNFTGNPEDRPSEEVQKEFQRLLNLFIQEYKISLTAKVKFAQCSPTTYR